MSISASHKLLATPLLALLDLVYPPRCAGCGAPLPDHRELLCWECWAAFSATGKPRCPLCSCPLDGPSGEGGTDSPECPNCAEWVPTFDRLLVLSPFEGPVQQAVHAFKFKQYRRLAQELGRRIALCEDLSPGLSELDVLIPVPLHPARQRERGYNQSLLLAQGISIVMGIPIENNILKRSRATSQQATLTAGERQANLRGAFQTRGDLPPDLHLGVVDDVVTTGATLNACAAALKGAGARSVTGVAVASPFRGVE